jgi:hypothetical protein
MREMFPGVFFERFFMDDGGAMSHIFKVGDRVLHSSFGKGAVLALASAAERDSEYDQVQVSFDSGKTKWLALIYAGLALLNEHDEPLRQNEDAVPWPVSTFVYDKLGAKHYPGSHWEPFFDSSKELFGRLPEIMPAALLQTCYGDNHPAPRELPVDWPKGLHLCWPLRVRGLGITELVDDAIKQIHIVSLYPFWVEGSQARLNVRRVNVWEGECEAQITAGWGDAEVCFFDTQYMAHRAWYEAGKSFEFVLSGIAYSAAPARPHASKIQHPPEVLAHINALLAQDGSELIEAEQEFSFDGAAIFLPVGGWDRDDYSFRAPIKEVREFDDFLGQKGWRVRATVMRCIGLAADDANLTIVITQRAWQSDSPPQVGQDIEGRLWLQGYLIYQ